MNDDQNKFLRWAREAFVAEVQTGFGRARTFDGFLSELQLSVLRRLPGDTLLILAQALPTGAGFTGAKGNEAFDTLPIDQKAAVSRFRERSQAAWEDHFQALSELIVKRRHDINAAETIKHQAAASILKIAAAWGHDVEQLRPGAWRTAWRERCTQFVVHWSLETPFELECKVCMYGVSGTPLREHDNYLGVLGVGPSVWAIERVEHCSQKLDQARSFLQWYLHEYARLVE